MHGFEAIRALARHHRAIAENDLGNNVSTTLVVRNALLQAGLELRRTSECTLGRRTILGSLERRGRIVYTGKWLGIADTHAVAAHELGHFHCHDDRHLDQFQVDAANKGSDGKLTLLGHSTVERVELEAEAFAAEFLCPLPDLSRRLRRGERPSEIATALQVPLRLVMRQAARALLVEPATLHAEPVALMTDPAQIAAATTSTRCFAIEGVAGSGKTSTIVARVDHLTKTGQPPASILVIDGSESCLAGLRRLIDSLGLSPPPWTDTLRALALEIVRKWPRALGRSRSVRLLDETAAFQLAEQAYSRVAGHSRSRRGAERELLRQRATGETHFADDAAIMKAYEDALAAEDAVDPAGILGNALTILENDTEAAAAFTRRFRHIVVDNYQEMSGTDYRLFAWFARAADSVFVATDPNGTIESYRGARGDGADAFVANFGGCVARYQQNRRACRDVAEAIERAAACVPITLPPSLTAKRRRGRVTVDILGSEDLEFDRVAANIEAARARGIPLKEQAIIARSNRQLAAMHEPLRRRGIDVVYVGDLLDRLEVRQLIRVIEAECQGGSMWVHATRYLLEDPGSRALIAAEGVEASVTRIAVQHVLDVIEEAEAIGDVGFERLIERLKRLRSLGQDTTYRRFAAEIAGIDGVRLLTVHGARGSAFGAVHVVGATGDRILSRRQISAASVRGTDEARVFLAALSRARQELHLTSARGLERRPPHRRSASNRPA